MDGRSPPVLRQEGAMKVDGAEAWTVPNHLRQHSKGHHDAQVGVPRVQLGVKGLILEFLGLGEGEVVPECNLFDVAGAQGLAAARRAVRGRSPLRPPHGDSGAIVQGMWLQTGCSEEHHTQGRRSF